MISDAFTKIRNILAKPTPTLIEISAGLDAARVEATNARTAASAARERALDPMIADPDEALKEANDAGFVADRAERAVSALAERLEHRKLELAEEGRQKAYDLAQRRTEELKRRFRQEYPSISAKLLDLIGAICETQLLINLTNSDLPEGGHYLLPAEDAARGISRDIQPMGWPPARIVEMLVPALDPARMPDWVGTWRSDGGFMGGNRLDETEAARIWTKLNAQPVVRSTQEGPI